MEVRPEFHGSLLRLGDQAGGPTRPDQGPPRIPFFPRERELASDLLLQIDPRARDRLKRKPSPGGGRDGDRKKEKENIKEESKKDDVGQEEEDIGIRMLEEAERGIA